MLRRHLILACCFLAGASVAEVHTDGSLGAKQSFRGTFNIPASLGKQKGGNLFHSFDTFNLSRGEIATFTAAGANGAIQNVIARVTGGAASSIDGTLACTIPNADFYFVNPAGVIFGTNSSLNVRGSFAVSTAAYLKFRDGTRFATGTTAPTLSTASPAAFGFLGHRASVVFVGRNTVNEDFNSSPSSRGDSGGIDDRTVLTVSRGKSLTVASSSISVAGTTLESDGGDVVLGAFGRSRVEIPVLPSAIQKLSISSPDGEIRMIDAAHLRGDGSRGVGVVIRGGSLFVAGSAIQSVNRNQVTAKPGGIDIDVGGTISFGAHDAAQSIGAVITTLVETTNFSDEGSHARTSGGDISIRASDLVGNYATIAAAANSEFVDSKSGSVRVVCNNLRTVSSLIAAVGDLHDENGPSPHSHAVGDVNVSVRGNALFRRASVQVSNSSPFGAVATSGVLSVAAGSITLQDGSSIRSDANLTTAGTTVTARRLLYSVGSQIAASVRFGVPDLPYEGIGPVTVSAPEIFLKRSSIVSGGGRYARLSGLIVVNAAKVLHLWKSAIAADAQSESATRGGDVQISARSAFLRASQISVDLEKPGQSAAVSGGVRLAVQQSLLLTDSSISASAVAGPQASGGSVLVRANVAVLLRGTSSIRAGSSGNGGNITIDPFLLSVAPSSTVSASAQGNGGKIVVNADQTPGARFTGPAANITATGGSGVSGSVATANANTDILNAVARLPADLLPTAVALQPQCGVGSAFSSFLFTGTGGMKFTPGLWFTVPAPDNAGEKVAP